MSPSDSVSMFRNAALVIGFMIAVSAVLVFTCKEKDIDIHPEIIKELEEKITLINKDVAIRDDSISTLNNLLSKNQVGESKTKKNIAKTERNRDNLKHQKLLNTIDSLKNFVKRDFNCDTLKNQFDSLNQKHKIDSILYAKKIRQLEIKVTDKEAEVKNVEALDSIHVDLLKHAIKDADKKKVKWGIGGMILSAILILIFK